MLTRRRARSNPRTAIGLTTIFAALIVTAALAVPAGASASVPPSKDAGVPIYKLLFIQQGSPMARVASIDSIPLHFHSSAGQAMLAAERNPDLISVHRRMHPLHVYPFVWRSTNPYWYVVFTYHGNIVADANVNRYGKVTGVWTGLQALAPYTHGGLAQVLTGWWILGPAALLFMLPFLDPRRLFRIVHLDALAVVAFLASWLFLANADLALAVWLVYPPLVYLLVRMLMIGFGRSHARAQQAPGRIAPLLSTPVLMVGLPLILAGRIVASILGHQEIDIGYESVIGAYRILHHLPIYYNDPNHGDTYGPITYLVYVPFELLIPWKLGLSQPHAADAAAIFFDLTTVLGLFLLGRKLRPGREGTRMGLVLAWAWAACPFTVIGVVVHTNDALIATLTVFALLAFSSPIASGALLGVAAAAKFSPAALVPLMAAPRKRGPKGALACVGAFTAVVVVAIYSWLPPGGLSYFWHRTLGFQLTRPDVFSPWGLHPTLHPLQLLLEALALGLAGAVAFLPRDRSLVRVAALAGAIMIAVQLPATHWYYYYIIWFLPFAIVASLAGPQTEPEPVADLAPTGEPVVKRGEPEPVLAGT